MIGKKINQLATELAPVSTDLTIIGDPISGVSKKITLAQLGAIFSGAVSFYTNLAGFPATGDINVIYCAKDTQKLYLWSGSAYTEVFPSQALLDTYQLRSEKGVSNGYASLDSGGKVPISQLPSSIMEYKGMWNAATNTPTLANGTGDTGDVYICNVAGTVNFGAGPITFAVGDYVIYSGSIWQRSSGAVGTVTSVGLSITGDSIGVSNSPITTSGTLALAFAGTSSQYINGAGNLTTFPSLTGFVPYTGATANVDLGTFDLTADFITGSRGSYTSSSGGNTLEISHTSGSGIALNITKGGNGEGLYINKTSGTGNAATIIGTLNATTLVKSGGTSTQFLKADGSVDSNTYLTTSAAATTYLPMVLSSTANFVDINGQQFSIYGSAGGFTSGRIIVDPVFSAIGYQNAGVFDGLKILTNGNAEFSNSGVTRFFNQVRFDSTLTDGTYTYTLPGATGTIALVGGAGVGTVTSVGLSSATSGVTIGSSPITTSGTITLAIATASGSQQGLLSSTDWTTFNNKQNALTNPVTGTGTTNYLPKFTGASTIGNSAITDDGSTVALLSRALSVSGASTLTGRVQGTEMGVTRNGSDTIGDGPWFRWTNAAQDRQMLTQLNASNGLTTWAFNGSAWTSLLTLTSSANLGLGVTPSAWSGFTALQIQNSSLSTTGSDVFLNANCFFNGSNWRYISSAAASQYYQDAGSSVWRIAPSGTAGNAISFTQAMTLDASGNLGVGATSVNSRLQVTAAAGLSHARWTESATTVGFVGGAQGIITGHNGKFAVRGESGLVLSGQGNSADMIISSTGAATFSSSVTATYGYFSGTGAGAFNSQVILNNTTSSPALITFQNTANGHAFGFNSTGTSRFTFINGGLSEIAYITSTGAATFSSSVSLTSGFLSVDGFGNKDTNYITMRSGFAPSDAGGIGFKAIDHSGSGTDGLACYGHDGVSFYTAQTERMRITSGGSLLVGTTSSGNGIANRGLITVNGSSTSMYELQVGGTEKGYVYHSGTDLYLNNSVNGGRLYCIANNSGVYLTTGATSWTANSDERLKTDLIPITNALDKVNELRSVIGRYKTDSVETKRSFLIAQDVLKVLPEAVSIDNDTMKTLGVRYTELIPLLVASIKELKSELDTLKNK